VYKVNSNKHTGSHYVCEDYYTKEIHTMSESGKYSFKTLKPIAEK